MTKPLQLWRVAFLTLACPYWSLERAIRAVAEYGYEGLEIRFLDGVVIGPSLSPADQAHVRQQLGDAGVPLVGIGSDVKVADPAPAVALDMGRHMLEVAAGVGAPLLRVYGGRFEGQSAGDAERQAAETLARLGDEARGMGVGIGLETHDVFASATRAARVLAAAKHPLVGGIWDWLNCYLQSGEEPTAAEALAPWLRHVHFKDGRVTGDGWTPMPLGTGGAPVADALAVLRRVGYQGWLSVEWEKAWHAEIDDPEIALPRERRALAAFGV